MHIRKCVTDNEWDRWIEQVVSYPSVTNSHAWLAILAVEGYRTERYAIFSDENLIGIFVCVEYASLGIRYAYSPRSPVITVQKDIDVDAVMRFIQTFLRGKGYAWWRCEPSVLPAARHGWREVQAVQPPATVLLDLQRPLDAILAAMHQKTRYNIRLAERKELILRYEKNVDVFWDLSRATSERDGFRLHPRSHYEAVILSSASEQITVYLRDKAVASAVCFAANGVYTYLFGASSYEARSLMAPYLVQWAAIRRAHELHFRWYDFYGVAPVGDAPSTVTVLSLSGYVYDEKGREAGYTRFKMGFGGHVIVTPGTWEVALRPIPYRVYRMMRAGKKILGI